VKDNILSMKDDFELTTGAFAKQLTDLKNQIQMERKKGAIQTASVLTWVSTLLNVILVLVLIVAVVLLIRKVTKTPTYTPTPSTS
jgi:galactitol-specific phosphotransferase system IIC component